jgi:hypothetical protein
MPTLREDGLYRKDVRHPTPRWYRQAIQKCFTQPEIEKLLKQLDPKDKLDILLKTLPKEIETKGESGLVIKLMLNNVKPLEIPGQIVKGALTATTCSDDGDEGD